MFGKEIDHAKILDEGFNELGDIIIYDDGFSITTDKFSIKGGFNYIKDINSSGGLSLGRVLVTLDAFDVLGDEHKIKIAMPEQTYLILKKKWEKSME
ncbi:hypothetical protein J7J90_02570 [Candidatus Micrarchaeota archaeon]|nr:hypothetical protein [Candidatus Micrarchaeota archaeon]